MEHTHSRDRTLPRVYLVAPTTRCKLITNVHVYPSGATQGREASKQSHVSSMIHGSVLARTSLEDAISCDVANKMATTFLSPTEVRLFARKLALGVSLLGSCCSAYVRLSAKCVRDVSVCGACGAGAWSM